MLEIGAIVKSKPFVDVLSALAKSSVIGIAKHLHQSLVTNGSSLHSHIQATYDRCTKIKTLLNRDEPIQLLSLYVNLKFRSDNKLVDDFDLIAKLDTIKRVVISGTGGGGKTMFMRYLWIALFENPKGRIPIFVELRRLNEGTNDRLDLFIYHSMIDSQSSLYEKDFEKGIKEGRFVLVLDGFDEIEEKKRASLEQQILALAHNNPDLIIVVSGRGDQRFSSWQAFSIFHVRPFSKSQTVKLIGNMHYDRVIRKKFSERVKKDLYDQHESFLSNPLLATMMLLTFDQFADIPEKIHLFYDQAFDTLFAKHDATKEAYKRRMYTELSIDVFKRLFSCFCLVTYYDEKFEITDSECLTYISRCLKIHESNVDPKLFLKDLTESVCMLQRDGMSFVFVHRSFQEYFSAYFLARVSRKNLDDVLKKIARRPTDNVIKMLYDIDQDFFERDFVLPNLGRLVTQIEAIDEERFVAGYCRIFEADLYVTMNGDLMELTHDRHSNAAHFVEALRKIYTDELEPPEEAYERFKKLDRRILRKNFGKGVKEEEAAFRIDVGLEDERAAWSLRAKEPVRPEKADGLQDMGYVKWCRMEAASLNGLLTKIRGSQGVRDKAIDELLGLKSTGS